MNNGVSNFSKWIRSLFNVPTGQVENITEGNSGNGVNAVSPFEAEVKNVLKSVIDPELEINIVDLGLIYHIEEPGPERILIEMTLSTPACPIGDVIVTNVIETLEKVYPTRQVDVNLVFEPAWHPGLLSDFGRKALAGKI